MYELNEKKKRRLFNFDFYLNFFLCISTIDTIIFYTICKSSSKFMVTKTFCIQYYTVGQNKKIHKGNILGACILSHCTHNYYTLAQPVLAQKSRFHQNGLSTSRIPIFKKGYFEKYATRKQNSSYFIECPHRSVVLYIN